MNQRANGINNLMTRNNDKKAYGLERAVHLEAHLDDSGLVLGEPKLVAATGAVCTVLVAAGASI